MPPVRDASTKPSAATDLPAPVACSNQKRRAALGAAGGASPPPPAPPSPPARAPPRPRVALVLLGRSLVLPVERLVLVFQLLVALEFDLAGRELLDVGGRRSVRAAVAVGALGLGEQRDQRAGKRVDLVGREHRPVDQLRLVLRQQPLEAEHQ